MQVRSRRVATPTSQGRLAQVAQRTAADELPRSPFSGIQWSLSFIAFVVYVFATTSFKLPIGTASAAMIVALVTLPLERGPLRLPLVAILALALVLWSFVGWTTTDYPIIVYDKITEFAKIIAVIVVAVNVLNSWPRLRFFLVGLLLTFLAFPVRGTLITYVAGSTLDGRAMWNYTYSNPNDLAGLCILQLAIALAVVQVEKERLVRSLAWIMIVVLPVIIILTQSRGAFIALLAVGLYLGRKHWRDVKKIVGILGLAGLVYMVAPESAWKRFGTIKNSTSQQADDRYNSRAEGSTAQRLVIWDVARTIAAENPITGIGFGAYPQAHYEYAQRPQFDPIAMGIHDAHSTYFTMLAETGLPGFLLFVGIIVGTLRGARRARAASVVTDGTRKALFYLESGLYGYLIAGIWGSYGALAPTYLYIAIILVVAHLVRENIRGTAVPAMRARWKKHPVDMTFRRRQPR